METKSDSPVIESHTTSLQGSSAEIKEYLLVPGILKKKGINQLDLQNLQHLGVIAVCVAMQQISDKSRAWS